MVSRSASDPDYLGSVRRLLLGLCALLLIAIFLVWRIDNARVEQVRTALLDQFVPSFEWALKPVAATAHMLIDFRAYTRVYAQNEELRRDVQRLQGWREAALQLEQKNARLLALNNVRLSPRLTYVTAEVVADAGSPFRRSVLLNVGREDGVEDGHAVVDGLGLVGRVAGVGARSARVLLLTDASSRVPGTILPSGQHALVSGDNSHAPVLDFVDRLESLQGGERVVSAGDGGLFPPDIPIGRVIVDRDGRFRIAPAPGRARLDFVRVLRRADPAPIEGPGAMIGPLITAQPALPLAGAATAQ